jgi:hypothetical protein
MRLAGARSRELPRLRAGLPPPRQVDRLRWVAGVAVETFGLRVGLRTLAAEALLRAADRLPPGRRLSTGRVDLLYSLALGGPGPRPGMRRSHRLYCGDVRIASSLGLEPVLDALESHARLHVAARSRRGVFLRAGAVAWGGRAVVIPGASRSDTTALVAELVKAGAGSLSGEFAVIRDDRVVPYPKLLSVHEAGGEGRPRPVAASELRGRHQRAALPIGLVVLGTLERGGAGRARRLTRGRALLSLLPHAVAARVAPREVLAALEGLVRAVPVVLVKRGDARAAARRILGWMERTG